MEMSVGGGGKVVESWEFGRWLIWDRWRCGQNPKSFGAQIRLSEGAVWGWWSGLNNTDIRFHSGVWSKGWGCKYIERVWLERGRCYKCNCFIPGFLEWELAELGCIKCISHHGGQKTRVTDSPNLGDHFDTMKVLLNTNTVRYLCISETLTKYVHLA